MPVTPTYPGVYVQEVPSGVRTIAGVGTSVTVLIGCAKSGPMRRPVLCLSYSDFVRTFSEDTSQGQLPYYVKLFFLNGGTQCYVVRIANNPAASSVRLANEASSAADVLELTAKQPGVVGETIRALVTYRGTQPEATFNIDLFRWDVQNGVKVQQDAESWKNLTMNPASPVYAADFLTQNSKLVSAKDLAGSMSASGFSLSGRPVQHANTGAAFKTAWAAVFGTAAARPTQHFLISVDGGPYTDVNLSTIDIGAMAAGTVRTTLLPAAIEGAIQTALGAPAKPVTVSFEDGPTPKTVAASTVLKLASTGSGDVFVRPASAQDLALPLMLGTEQGGLEVSAYAMRRPAPNGISLRASDPAVLRTLAALTQDQVKTITLEKLPAGGGTASDTVNVNLETTAAADKMFTDATVNSPNGNNDGVREKLGKIAAAINAKAASSPEFPWKAEVAGSRLTLLPGPTAGDNLVSTILATGPTDLTASFTRNVKYYTLGAGGVGGRQTAGTAGSDGNKPQAGDYDDAYDVIDKEVDLFNLMVLPPDAAVSVQSLYGGASNFCQRRRAFLLMDPPASWTTVQKAIDTTSGVNSLRVGLVKDYSALFYPRVTISDGGRQLQIGPAGAIAGLMARIDGSRGVWKAPAGTEADLRGITGLEYRFSDGENGVMNPRAVNALRVFPNGIVNWGGRTMDGDDNFGSEYKYIPVRRLALFLEESLYRGLKWVVFEPNDEPLWAQIRLNVGAFMHDMFRKGAFQGATPRDAYFVKCDGETTTQNDRNLGIVNIWVGFAPLKPAEFVVLYLQQMAGQVQV